VHEVGDRLQLSSHKKCLLNSRARSSIAMVIRPFEYAQTISQATAAKGQGMLSGRFARFNAALKWDME